MMLYLADIVTITLCGFAMLIPICFLEYPFFHKYPYIPDGKFSWSSYASSHTTNILVSPTTAMDPKRPDLRTLVVPSSGVNIGLSAVDILRGFVPSRSNVFGLIADGWSPCCLIS